MAQSLQEIQEELLKKYINLYLWSIYQALDNEAYAMAIQEFVNFGSFLQEQYPGIVLYDLYEQLSVFSESSKDFNTVTIPEISFLGKLIAARIEESMAIADAEEENLDKINVYKMDALLKGIGTFSFFLGKDRFEKALELINTNYTQSELNDIKRLISTTIYQIGPKILEAARQKEQALLCLTKIRDEIDKTLQIFKSQISMVIRKAPEHYSPNIEAQKSIEDLIKTVNEEEIDSQGPIKHFVEEYEELIVLQKTLDRAGTPQKKIRNFREQLYESSLALAPEPSVTIKKSRRGFFDLTIPSKSPTQKFFTAICQILKNTAPNEILPLEQMEEEEQTLLKAANNPSTFRPLKRRRCCL